MIKREGVIRLHILAKGSFEPLDLPIPEAIHPPPSLLNYMSQYILVLLEPTRVDFLSLVNK